MVLIQTDFPEPVVPATNKCGISAKSAITISSLIFFPTQIANGLLWEINSREPSKSLIETVPMVWLGTSIPMAFLPSIGLSIRVLLVFKAKFMSSRKFSICATRVPSSGTISKRVTAGATLKLSTRARTLYCWNSSFNLISFSLASALNWLKSILRVWIKSKVGL